MLPGREIEFKVADSGIGIPKEKINGIFAMFRQVESSATRKFAASAWDFILSRNTRNYSAGALPSKALPDRAPRSRSTFR